MRISGGKARGVALSVSKPSVHRPATDRLRQGIFSSLGKRIEHIDICDLFAGTGSYGLEALSRGAASATFVEMNRRACEMIRRNIAIVSKSMDVDRLNATVLAKDATKPYSFSSEPFDLIFADPPYEFLNSIGMDLFRAADRNLKADGLFILEAPGNYEYDAQGWTLSKRIGKGTDQPTALFYERKQVNAKSV